MQSKQWIVLVIVLGLVLLGSCDDESRSKNKNKDKQEGKDEGKEEETDISKNLCKNVTLAVKQFNLDITDERYNVIFRKKGENSCRKTVKKLTKLGKKLRKRGVKATVHIDNCDHDIKLVSLTLNPKGLEWVCTQKKIKSVTHDPAPPINPQTGVDPNEGSDPFIG